MLAETSLCLTWSSQMSSVRPAQKEGLVTPRFHYKNVIVSRPCFRQVRIPKNINVRPIEQEVILGSVSKFDTKEQASDVPPPNLISSGDFKAVGFEAVLNCFEKSIVVSNVAVEDILLARIERR